MPRQITINMFRTALSILFFGFFLQACGGLGYYNPDPKIVNGVMIPTPGIKPADITIINAQESKETHRLDFREIEVNYHDFTQSLVKAIETELVKNNVNVVDAANRSLRVSVEKIAMFHDAVNFRAIIKAKVQFDNGKYKMFTATRATYASPFMQSTFPTKPLDAAFKDLVGKIVNDKTVKNYIQL